MCSDFVYFPVFTDTKSNIAVSLGNQEQYIDRKK